MKFETYEDEVDLEDEKHDEYESDSDLDREVSFELEKSGTYFE